MIDSNVKMLRRLGLLIASPVAIGLVLAGCGERGTPATPQILTFNWQVQTVPNASLLIASVQSGQSKVSDLLASNPCNMTADFTSAPTPPQVFINGMPGQTGFNVNIVSTDPISTIATTNPTNCPGLDEIEINIGARTLALALGAPANLTNGRIALADGRDFATSAFFEATIRGFDSGTRRSNGDFRFINRLSPGSNTVLIVDGSYAMTP